MEVTEGTDMDIEGGGVAGAQSSSSGPQASVAPRRHWALTQETFDKLLATLGPDRDSAGEKYLELRGNLIRFFEWRGCPFPEDHADETINRVARRIDQAEEIRDPSKYSLGVARLRALEIHKELAKERQALGELTSSPITSYKFAELEPRVVCLERCLQNLSPDNRELILHYYQGEGGTKIENRKRLTERFRVSLNTLRMRVLRLKETLLLCVEDCLKK